MTMHPRTGEQSARSLRSTTSLYQALKSAARVVSFLSAAIRAVVRESDEGLRAARLRGLLLLAERLRPQRVLPRLSFRAQPRGLAHDRVQRYVVGAGDPVVRARVRRSHQPFG